MMYGAFMKDRARKKADKAVREEESAARAAATGRTRKKWARRTGGPGARGEGTDRGATDPLVPRTSKKINYAFAGAGARGLGQQQTDVFDENGKFALPTGFADRDGDIDGKDDGEEGERGLGGIMQTRPFGSATGSKGPMPAATAGEDDEEEEYDDDEEEYDDEEDDYEDYQ